MVVGPIFTQPPFEVGYDIAGKAEAWDVIMQLRLTVAANILSLPAAAVPTGIGDTLGTFTPIDPRA